MQRSMYKDQERQPKPLIDEYEMEVFDQRINYAMEYNLAVRLTVWTEGFTRKITGQIHNVDPVSKDLRIEVKPGEFKRIKLWDVIGLNIIEEEAS